MVLYVLALEHPQIPSESEIFQLWIEDTEKFYITEN